ncbi:hypothetical protein [Pseudovibrio sp. SPO723]|uniref:hypothetical protein n=1 Tax=Nesiotobacter zosterae TaxID=392721 RepID=UPI0029C4F735|nr:hypothetical protein [Pseudovibrio sp. SPO723]MDX5592560.1 hypothetical protein [Pseudovibrio sp. SPO723]
MFKVFLSGFVSLVCWICALYSGYRFWIWFEMDLSSVSSVVFIFPAIEVATQIIMVGAATTFMLVSYDYWRETRS